MRVLVADHPRSLRMIIAQTVISAGHDVIEAVDGNEVIDLFDKNQIDLVVMDAEMP